jgi:Carboxypeptidase regulatory-like domain
MLLVAVVGGALARTSASAQQPAPPRPAGPRTIVGIVADTTGIPLDSVELLISSVRRRAMSGPDGTFRFDDLKPGKYQIAARRLGFYPQVHDVTVGDRGGVVSFSLLRGIPALPPVVSSVARGGLSGVIGDTAYNIVEGAKIAVVASDHRTVSDSMGRFFLDLKPGKYMVNVSRRGYATRLVSVTIPNDSGRRMTVWLTPADQAQTARDAAVLDSLTLRLELRNPAFSTIFTREDINRLHIEDGVQLARLGGN